MMGSCVIFNRLLVSVGVQCWEWSWGHVRGQRERMSSLVASSMDARWGWQHVCCVLVWCTLSPSGGCGKKWNVAITPWSVSSRVFTFFCFVPWIWCSQWGNSLCSFIIAVQRKPYEWMHQADCYSKVGKSRAHMLSDDTSSPLGWWKPEICIFWKVFLGVKGVTNRGEQ